MNLLKLVALGSSSLVGLVLATVIPAESAEGPAAPPKAKKKDDRETGGEMKKAYDLLRQIRSDNRNIGRPEERLKDWTERASQLYRDAVKAHERGQEQKARELGVAAHDLARAVDHARNAATFDLDDQLPPPPEPGGPEGDDERTRRDLRHAYDRITSLMNESETSDLKFYLAASKDLYNAARRDAQAERRERAGELARAAEALTHVPEHIARAEDPRFELEPRKEKKEKKDRPELREEKKEKKDRPEPREKKDRPEPREKKDRLDPIGELPPPID